jgi:hypothetical protein
MHREFALHGVEHLSRDRSGRGSLTRDNARWELPADRTKNETRQRRAEPFIHRFGRYMRRLGLAEIRDGHRRSLVNFHSFRRWFATKVEQAGQAATRH